MPLKKNTLSEYRRKRQFEETPEPSGKVGKSKGALRFVIHKHAATRTHFDLRLEMGGVYKSWAVPKGPSLSPSDQRLAVHVEDHPIEYGNFEGTIPKGNYGAGTVMIWDHGTYVSRKTPDRKPGEKYLLDGLANGHITFVLEGRKLNGEFALIRLKGRDPKAWLLVKKHDAHSSYKTTLFEEVSSKTGRTMGEIAAERQGAVWTSGRKNKPVPKNPIEIVKPSSQKKTEMPRRIRVMQALLSMRPPDGGPWLYAPSWNEMRVVAEIEKGKAKLFSKMQLPLDKRYPSVVAALSKLPGKMVLDGEIMKKGGAEVFRVFDLLYRDGVDLRARPLIERLGELKKVSGLENEIHYADASEAAKAGAPFLLAKKKSGPYVAGLSKDWVRFRPSSSGVLRADVPPLTHREKLFWPREKITKGDLIAYYDSMSEFILPHLIDRPESLHRQPNGVKDAGFFHKDMVGFLPRRVRTHRVQSGSSGKTVNYILCQDRWTLLYLINLGCIELNPWLSRIKALEKPDFAVIDLDPDDNSFEEVIKVAQETHKILKSIGAEGFCKTSGASGLHICVPTGGKFDYETTRRFCERICRKLHEKFPAFTSLERNPGKRRGKIYLDYMQNRRGQTLAAPYCVRPHPGAPVSAPLKWIEVKPGLSPKQFNIHNIKTRVKKIGDLWKPMLTKAVDLEKCLKGLGKR